jgi:hypothetical protein
MPCCLCCFLAYNVLCKGEKTPSKHTVISHYCYYYFLLFHCNFISIINNNVDKARNFKFFNVLNVITSSNSFEHRADKTDVIKVKSIKIRKMTVRGRRCTSVYCLPGSQQITQSNF